MTTLGSVIGCGTLAARPAASIAGRLYFATDTALWYRDNGSSWDTNDTVTTKGDVRVFDGTKYERLAVGTNNQVLTADSAQALGVKWAALAATTFRGVLATSSATTTIATSTFTAVALAAADTYDTDAYHDPVTNNSRLTVPSGLGGYYHVWGNAEWDANTTGTRLLVFYKNGVGLNIPWVRIVPHSGGLGVHGSGVVNLAATDYVEMMVWQDSGANRTVGGNNRTHFGMALLGT